MYDNFSVMKFDKHLVSILQITSLVDPVMRYSFHLYHIPYQALGSGSLMEMGLYEGINNMDLTYFS